MTDLPNTEGYMVGVRSPKLEDSGSAERLMGLMTEYIRRYGYATVNDFRDQCGLPVGRYLEELWGWTDAEEIFERSIIRRTPRADTWVLIMPRPHRISASEKEPKTAGEVVNSTILANLLIQARDLMGTVGVDYSDEFRQGVIMLVADTLELTFEMAKETIMTTSTPDYPYPPVLTQSNAPAGLVVTIGHPDNGRRAVKGRDGFWRDTDNGWVLDEEDFRAGWNPFIADLDGFQGYEGE